MYTIEIIRNYTKLAVLLIKTYIANKNFSKKVTSSED